MMILMTAVEDMGVLVGMEGLGEGGALEGIMEGDLGEGRRRGGVLVVAAMGVEGMGGATQTPQRHGKASRLFMGMEVSIAARGVMGMTQIVPTLF